MLSAKTPANLPPVEETLCRGSWLQKHSNEKKCQIEPARYSDQGSPESRSQAYPQGSQRGDGIRSTRPQDPVAQAEENR